MPRRSPKSPKVPSVHEAERRLGWKAADWAGNCYAVACQFVAKGLVKGTAVYGHWLGEIAPDSYFGKLGRGGTFFVQHGWIVCDDGTVVDPTRWGFDGKAPYIHVGPPSPEYDEGGNHFRTALRRPPPKYNRKRPQFELTQEILPIGTWKFVESLLEIEYWDVNSQDPGVIDLDQLFWLANLSIDELGPIHAPALYEAFEKLGQTAAIPIDNRNLVRRMKARRA